MEQERVDSAKLKAIERGIRKLPQAQREVLLAVRFDDLSYDAIAHQSGRSAAAVEHLFASALSAITRALEPGQQRWWRRL
jgi:DNA-directed RNA polymerase specialized sigma24 family protein